MDDSNGKISMHIIQGCLVVPIQIELTDEAVLGVQSAILQKVHATGIKGVILDLSDVEIADAFLGNTIKNIVRMTALLGATTVVTGLQPGVVASLVDLEIEFGDIHTVLTHEDGFKILAELTEPIEDESSEEEEETDNTDEIDEDNRDEE
jgi:rsbT antagonist protein RsbS